jgi:5'(3')-deoxyribonucleotidase
MTRRPRIGIDIDNVIAQTDEVMRRLISQCSHGRVNLQYHDIVRFDYCRCRDAAGNQITKQEWRAVHELFSEPQIIRQVRPLAGVQRHLETLAQRFELHFATARLPRARKATVEWLEAHGFPPHSLHFLHQCEKHLSLSGFHAVVDDDYSQVVAFLKAGTRRGYVMSHPWNARCPKRLGLCWVKGWGEIAGALLGRERSG